MSSPQLHTSSSTASLEKRNDAVIDESLSQPTAAAQKKDRRFPFVFVAICVSVFTAALELTIVAAALPTIIQDLKGTDFVWVGTAYALAATALLPASGAFAELFGRRPAMLLGLGMFALGGALCGTAKSMSWLIAGRTIQGAGGGSIQAVSSIIISDLVPLNERAIYNTVIGLAFGTAAAVGPLIGGSLTKSGDWRWIFYLTLPASGLSAALVFTFLKLRIPPGTFKEKMRRMDWIGNAIVMASSTAVVIALTWGGIQFPWTSARTLAPLILGLFGIGAWLAYEARWATHPIVPYRLLSNRTSLSGYIQTFIVPIPVFATMYYLPSYYQACKGASPLRAGVLTLPSTVVFAPVLLISGISINVTKAYRPQLVLGWCSLVLGMALYSIVRADSRLSLPLGVSSLAAIGAGFVYTGTYFPVLAPLNVKDNAYALSFFAYCRQFAAVWGVSVGGAILQNQLNHKLPPEFIAQLPSGAALAYAAIPAIPALDEPLRSQVRNAFGDGFAVIWQVMAGISGIGLLASLLMKGLRLHTEIDERWGLEQDRRASTAGSPTKELPVDVCVGTARVEAPREDID